MISQEYIILVSQLMKLYILSAHSFLYVNHTCIKWFKKIQKKLQSVEQVCFNQTETSQLSLMFHLHCLILLRFLLWGFPDGASDKKNPPANAGDIRDAGSIPRSGRSPGGGNGNQSVQQVHVNQTKTSQLVLILQLHSFIICFLI